ncbi:MAG TPA: hypothetical protein VM658_04440 [bacterium]|nr:hypothetical protein [bacterium]
MKGMAKTGIKYCVLMLALAGLISGCKGVLGGRSDLSKARVKAANRYNINLNGGRGDTGDGGMGGGIFLDTDGSLGINILGAASVVDMSFDLPQGLPALDFGDVPLVVAANMAIDVYEDQPAAQDAVEDGGYYMFLDDGNIWLRDSELDDVAVTGLHVLPGRTLTLGLNVNEGNNDGQDSAEIFFEFDVMVEGVIKTKTLDTGNVGDAPVDINSHGMPGTDKDKAWLILECGGTMIIRGAIDQSGADGARHTGEDGGDGGATVLYAFSSIFILGNVDASGGTGDGVGDGGAGAAWSGAAAELDIISEQGMVAVAGNVNASGGKGKRGGSAGKIYIDLFSNFYGIGSLLANGGDGADGYGGHANAIVIVSHFGSIYYAGAMLANGGNATYGDAGNGGGISLSATDGDSMGELFLSGSIQSKGGTSFLFGVGGDGDTVELNNSGSGDIRITAPIDLSGGDGDGPGRKGGDAGGLLIMEQGVLDLGYGQGAMTGNIILAANVNLNGGNGDIGGAGGLFQTLLYHSWDVPTDCGIFFLGYADIRAMGGNGGDNGGVGGYFEAYTHTPWSFDGLVALPTGPIIDETNFLARGGDGELGYGGSGYIGEEEPAYYAEAEEGEAYIGTTIYRHKGSIDVSGGNGNLGGGFGGIVEIYGHDGVTFNGSLDLSGGNGTGADVSGGDAVGIQIISTCDLNFTGNANLSGGNGTGAGTGGLGGYFGLIAGRATTMVGNLDVSGGDAGADPLNPGVGGDGGVIELLSEGEDIISIFQGSYNILGGSADTPGLEGQLWIDGILIDPSP